MWNIWYAFRCQKSHHAILTRHIFTSSYSFVRLLLFFSLWVEYSLISNIQLWKRIDFFCYCFFTRFYFISQISEKINIVSQYSFLFVYPKSLYDIFVFEKSNVLKKEKACVCVLLFFRPSLFNVYLFFDIQTYGNERKRGRLFFVGRKAITLFG